MRLVKGISEKSAIRATNSRAQTQFSSISNIKHRALFTSEELNKLINANAFHLFEHNRRRSYWQALQINDGLNTQTVEPSNFIRPLSQVESMLADYQHARGVSIHVHPMQILRKTPPFNRCTLACKLLTQRNNSLIEISGVVTGRQRPSTASGVIFMTIEDETGNINVVLWKSIQERFRKQILTGHILYIKGQLEHKHGVANVIAGYIEQHDNALPSLKTQSRNFH